MGTITPEIATMSLQSLNIDKYGLDEIDNKILLTIIDKFRGGPVGVSTIATAIGEDSGTVEEVYEPFPYYGRVSSNEPSWTCGNTACLRPSRTKCISRQSLYNRGLFDYKNTPLQTFTMNNAVEFSLFIPLCADICKLFSYGSKPTHALLV